MLIVPVAFRRRSKVYYFDPNQLALSTGDRVIVKTVKGIEYGDVVAPPTDVPEQQITKPLKKVLRRASDEDQAKIRDNEERREEALATSHQKIAEHNLPMRLVDVEVAFDRSKITFYFTAEERVDFRDLVKDLAGHFRTRIELRQIGVRDKAKMIGGLGGCGQRLCCTVWLSDLDPVSIRMAKEQDLPLNPMKISGLCGRLMCCLRYENEAYKDFKRRAPKRGACVETCTGMCGKVVDFNVPREKLTLEVEGRHVSVPLADLKVDGKADKTKKDATAEDEPTVEQTLSTKVDDLVKE